MNKVNRKACNIYSHLISAIGNGLVASQNWSSASRYGRIRNGSHREAMRPLTLFTNVITIVHKLNRVIRQPNKEETYCYIYSGAPLTRYHIFRRQITSGRETNVGARVNQPITTGRHLAQN